MEQLRRARLEVRDEIDGRSHFTKRSTDKYIEVAGIFGGCGRRLRGGAWRMECRGAIERLASEYREDRRGTKRRHGVHCAANERSACRTDSGGECGDQFHPDVIDRNRGIGYGLDGVDGGLGFPVVMR